MIMIDLNDLKPTDEIVILHPIVGNFFCKFVVLLKWMIKNEGKDAIAFFGEKDYARFLKDKNVFLEKGFRIINLSSLSPAKRKALKTLLKNDNI
jgi:hypothetical protein